MDVISHGLRSASVSFFKTRVRGDASFTECSINQLAMTDSQVERDLRISGAQFEGPASLEEVKVGRRLDCYEVKQSAGFEETTEGVRSDHCFLANKSDFGEVGWRKCELGFKGGFTDCHILEDLHLTDCASRELVFNNVTITGDAQRLYIWIPGI
jgi:hypothetical protein